MDKVLVMLVLFIMLSGYAPTGYAQEIDRSISLEHYQALQAPMFLQLSDQSHLLRVADVEGREQRDEKPPLSPIRIAGETVGGTLAGLGGGMLAIMTLLPNAEDSGFKDAILTVGLSTAYAFGSGTCVYLIGNIGDQTGSFRATMLGVLTGGAVGIIGAIITVAVSGNDNDDCQCQVKNGQYWA